MATHLRQTTACPAYNLGAKYLFGKADLRQPLQFAIQPKSAIQRHVCNLALVMTDSFGTRSRLPNSIRCASPGLARRPRD